MATSSTATASLIGLILLLFAAAGCRPEGRIDRLEERMDALERTMTAIEDGTHGAGGPADNGDRGLTPAGTGHDSLSQRMETLERDLRAMRDAVEALDRPTEGGQSTGDASEVSDMTVMEVTVGPELRDCVGVGPQKCLVVNGGLFYDAIQGFTHEEGYTYRLKIARYEAFPGQEEIPQDASKYRYRLLEVLSRTAR